MEEIAKENVCGRKEDELGESSVFALYPDLPVVVFAQSLASGREDNNWQGVCRVKVGEIASWDDYTYDNEESFISDYCYAHQPGKLKPEEEEKIVSEARELWKKHATKCIIFYAHRTALPKRSEIE